jgi:hypothetical protein
MPASDKIIHLRELLAERFPQTGASADQRLPTGVPVIDGAIGGGLPKSAITELTSSNLSAGSALFTHALLQEAHRRAFFLALVDGRLYAFANRLGCEVSHPLSIRRNVGIKPYNR